MKLMDKWQGGDCNFVFHSGYGKPYYHTTPTQRWKDWCEKNGFRYVTLHDLRHTNATYLLEQGESNKEIQHRLRHATSQVTSDTYAHVTNRLSRKTASHLDKFDPRIRPQRQKRRSFFLILSILKVPYKNKRSLMYQGIFCAFLNAEDRDRTGTVVTYRRILSPVRLPIPPPRHKFRNANLYTYLSYKYLRNTHLMKKCFHYVNCRSIGHQHIIR